MGHPWSWDKCAKKANSAMGQIYNWLNHVSVQIVGLVFVGTLFTSSSYRTLITTWRHQ
jgi:hypothetical protein